MSGVPPAPASPSGAPSTSASGAQSAPASGHSGSENEDEVEEVAVTDRQGVKWFRPTNNRSAIWKYMKYDEKKTSVKCDLCPKVFKFNTGGTSTLRRHLENVHKLNLKEDVTPKKGSNNASSQLSILDYFLRDNDFLMCYFLKRQGKTQFYPSTTTIL